MATQKPLWAPILLVVVGLALVIGTWAFTQTSSEQPQDEIENVSTTDATQTLLQAANLTQEQQAQNQTNAASTPAGPTVKPTGRFIGDANAPVQIIEFASLTCGHCAHFHNNTLDDLRTKYVDTGLARIEFRPFPLNKPALDATKILSCLPEEQFYPFMTVLFQTQDHWAFTADYLPIIRQNAKLAGMTDAAFDTCMNDKSLDEKLTNDMRVNAEKYKIESTPTFILNDGAARVVGAVPIDAFAKEIDTLLPIAKTPAQTEPAAK